MRESGKLYDAGGSEVDPDPDSDSDLDEIKPSARVCLGSSWRVEERNAPILAAIPVPNECFSGDPVTSPNR